MTTNLCYDLVLTRRMTSFGSQLSIHQSSSKSSIPSLHNVLIVVRAAKGTATHQSGPFFTRYWGKLILAPPGSSSAASSETVGGVVVIVISGPNVRVIREYSAEPSMA